MSGYFETMDAIKDHIIKAIYRTTPSKGDHALPRWKKYKDQDLEKAIGLSARLFDVQESEDEPEQLYTCNATDDYDVTLDIEIVYPNNKQYNSIARGDFSVIRGEIMTASTTALNNTGFNFYRFGEPILEPEDDKEYMFYTIPLICQISVSHEIAIPELGTYKDLIGDTDVYKDSIGNFDVYKDVI